MNFNRVILGSIIWVITSIGIATGLHLILNISFFPTFFVCLLAQYFIGDTVYRVLAAKDITKARELEKEMLDQMSQQYAQVKCPCDKNTSQLVMLNINQENLYNCNACNKELKCLVGWKSFQTTEPLTQDPFKNFNFVENKDYEIQ